MGIKIEEDWGEFQKEYCRIYGLTRLSDDKQVEFSSEVERRTTPPNKTGIVLQYFYPNAKGLVVRSMLATMNFKIKLT